MTTTYEKFSKFTSAAEVAEAFKDSIHGKHILITGVSPGSLGEAATLAIAKSHPGLLILASRTPSKLDAVAKRLKSEIPGVRVHTVTINLAAQASIRTGAEKIKALTNKIDVLINNAGVSLGTRQISEEGIELTFATNHVGPFLLTNLLLPLLVESAKVSGTGNTRVINVASGGHYISPMRFSDFNFEGAELPDDERPPRRIGGPALATVDGFPGILAYGQSKTANILFSVALRERLRSQVIDTGLSRESNEELRKMLSAKPAKEWQSPDQGCAGFLVAAFDPRLAGAGSPYLVDCQIGRPARHATDQAKAARLWELSEKLTGLPKGGSRL